MGERQNKARAAEGPCHRHDFRELLSRGLPACSAEEESSRMRLRDVAKDMAVEAAPRDQGEEETRQRVEGTSAEETNVRRDLLPTNATGETLSKLLIRKRWSAHRPEGRTCVWVSAVGARKAEERVPRVATETFLKSSLGRRKRSPNFCLTSVKRSTDRRGADVCVRLSLRCRGENRRKTSRYGQRDL